MDCGSASSSHGLARTRLESALMSRMVDVQRFYALMDILRERLGDTATLRNCTGRLRWPSRGVYFFFEPGERRTESGTGDRVVRVGTHALSSTSRTSLWHRLSQHAGSRTSGSGNHRGLIFRLLVGEAMKARDMKHEPKTWGIGSHPGIAAERLGLTASHVRAGERDLESGVSHYIGDLPFLFVAAEDEAGPSSIRGTIERNSIALLSNYHREFIDTASPAWLGRYSGRERVRESGLWNNNHVDEAYDPRYLEILERAVSATGPVT